jgi:GT2 family glycosyltransferase
MSLPPDSLDIVIVNYRSLADVRRHLTSDVMAEQHVIVVDNASDPDEVAELCSGARRTAILLPENRGFAAGVNAALPALSADRRAVLLLNPDAEPTADDLQRLRAALSTVDGVAPVLVGADGRVQVGSAGGPLTVRSVLAYFWFISHLLPRVNGIMWTRRQGARGGRAAWLCAACLMLRPDVFERFGVLPEDELVYGEDCAWGTAANKLGARWALVPEARIVHRRGASGGSAAWIAALARLYARRMPGWQARVAIWLMHVGLLVRRGLRRQLT